MIGLILISTFWITGFVYAYLAAFTAVFYRGKPISELSMIERKIAKGEATFLQKIGFFIWSLFLTTFFPPAYIIAILVALIFYVFTVIF